ncbi:D-lactate ferricytochrome c oxidoreductase [Cystobasidiomycetes sp. EMM_F5]
MLPIHYRSLSRSARLSPSISHPHTPSYTRTRSISSSAVRLGSHLPPRNTKYKKLTREDVEAFKGMTSGLLSTVQGAETASEDDLVAFNQDWMQKYKGNSQVILKPKSTEEVSRIVAYCVENNIAITPQGGNTGLVGGSVPVYDEVVLSLVGLFWTLSVKYFALIISGLNKIRSFDPISGVLTADAGCILETLDAHCAEQGYIMPLDLGAKGSCHIGGNVATNAGGLRLVRYGSLRGTVLGLEVVLPDEKGTVLHSGMGGLRKDNTGYDLKQLFIGSEGSLGIITGVCILTAKRSTARNVAILKVPNWQRLQDVFVATRDKLGEVLSAFEFFDQEAYELVLSHTGQKAPLDNTGTQPGENNFYILIETSGSNKDHDDEKLNALVEDLMEREVVVDGVVGQDETQMNGLWGLREAVPEACGKAGKVYK